MIYRKNLEEHLEHLEVVLVVCCEKASYMLIEINVSF